MNKNIVFLLIFLVFAWVLYLFKSFLLPISVACLLAVATSNAYAKCLELSKGKKLLSSIVMSILMLLLFLLPICYAIVTFIGAARGFDYEAFQAVISRLKAHEFSMPESLEFLRPKVEEFLDELDIAALFKQALGYVTSAGKLGAKFFVEFGLISVFYFFANYYGRELILFLKSLLPLKDDQSSMVLSEISSVMALVFYSTIFIAVFEGLLFGFAAYLIGHNALLFIILYAVASLIPLVGGMLLWLPLGLYELSQGHSANAIFIVCYSLLVISLVADTLVKPLFIKWINERFLKVEISLSELLIFFAMLAGISSFGFWGIVIGPAILALFASMLKIYVFLKEQELLN